MRTQARERVVAQVKTYTVVVDRDQKYWRIRVEEVERTTMATSLAKVDEMARDLVSIMTDEPDDSFDLDIRLELSDDVVQARTKAANLRSQADQAAADASALNRQAALLLREQGLTVRDIGAALDISFQRAQQLLSDPPRPRQAA